LKSIKQNKEKQSSVVKESQMKKEYFENKERQLNEALKKLKKQLLQTKPIETDQKEELAKSS
jgi:hypothetical protein